LQKIWPNITRKIASSDMSESAPTARRQTPDAQLEQLKAVGCAKVYREKATGAQVERHKLQRMLKAMAPGDVVTVTHIDRLARSTFDLFSIVKQIVDAGG
jgi:DNA invertase Pin-like site-specific DNA recombinase